MLRTFYICAILLGGSYLFSNSTQTLIITPIERMIEKIVDVIDNPQKVKEKAFIQEEEEVEHKKMSKKDIAEGTVDNKSKDSMETAFLEEAINKIGILMGVGFGEAGTAVINSYLNQDSDLLKEVVQVDAIFGFCDIRNFTDATEVLQEEVMVFVNSIAEIVHTWADRTVGAANKNIGDAFLLVWKAPDSIRELVDDEVISKQSVDTNFADLALFSFFKMYAEINRSAALLKYVNNEKLKKRCGKGYKVRLGYGLHFGWSIEGPIGSHYKVDISYLSPHVNMAGRMEGETKAYGVPMLLTGDFYDILSGPVKQYVRQVDEIETSESTTLRIYAPLIDDKYLHFAQFKPLPKSNMQAKESYSFKKMIKHEIKQGTIIGGNLFQNDTDVSLITSAIPPTFKQTFDNSFKAFQEGKWRLCIEGLEKGLLIYPGDGPTMFLLNYMKGYENKPPEGWAGVRADQGASH